MRDDSNINMAWLVAFESAARTLSFTKTAKELNLSQGAVSIQIRNLEKSLGAALFERRGRHIVLTDEGLSYFPEVNRALSSLRETTSRLFTGARRNVVTISCFSPTFADHWIAPKLNGLMSALPNVQIDMTIDYQASKTRNAGDDLVFAVGSGTGLKLYPIVKEHLIAVCAPSYHTQFGDNWMSGTLIESVGSRETWANWREATGGKKPSKARQIRVNSMSAALKMAIDGAGAALIAREFITDSLATGTLVELAGGKSIPGRVHGLALEDAAKIRPNVQAVATYFFDAVNRTCPADLFKV